MIRLAVARRIEKDSPTRTVSNDSSPSRDHKYVACTQQRRICIFRNADNRRRARAFVFVRHLLRVSVPPPPYSTILAQIINIFISLSFGETIRTDKFPRRLFGLFVEINRIKITNNDNIREKYKFAMINHGIERLTFRPIERRTL